MEEKLDKFLSYLEENGVEISGETAFIVLMGLYFLALMREEE